MRPYTFNQRIENLYKSYFSTYKNICFSSNEDQIKINLIEEQNLDSASLELLKFENCHQITFGMAIHSLRSSRYSMKKIHQKH